MIEAIARWSVQNRVAVNILMALIIVAGVIAVNQMNRETLPAFNLDMIMITVSYPTASPEEVEESICVKVEEAIKGIDGIRNISSTASENIGTILVELESDVSDTRRIVDEVQTEVDRIETFPEEAKEPMVQEVILREPVIYVALYGNESEKTLRSLAEDVRDDLTDTKSITQAELAGARDFEISIELSEENLRKYNLTFDQVSARISANSMDLPAGTVETPGEEITIRAEGRRYTGREYENLPVKTLPDGTIIILDHIANIIDGFEDTDEYVRFNGRRAVIVAVSKTPDQDLLDISETVHRYIDKIRNTLPSGVSIDYFFDQSDMVHSRINLLLRNGFQGLVLVFIVLALFLNMRLAFWVAMGIPISFMGAFAVLGMHGDSINMISLFAFIMVLGMVVDDAIIIGENIYTKYRENNPPVKACVEGTAQVGWPVIMTILTTVTAFMPLFFVSGIMGKFISVMPLAVIACLFLSLFEGLFILPAHLAHSLEKQEIRKKKNKLIKKKKRFVQRVEDGLERFISHIYGPFLKKALRQRYLALAGAICILIIAIGLVKGGRVPYVLFPKTDSDWIVAKISFPYGTPVEVTEQAIDRMEKVAKNLDYEFASEQKKEYENNPPGIVGHIFTMVGRIMGEQGESGESGSH